MHLICYRKPIRILNQVKVRLLWTVFSLAVTWFTSYYFAEELLFLLVKPLKTLPSSSRFICTQLTEALYTNLLTASITCCYFILPLLSYHIWSVLVPFLSWKRRKILNRFLSLSFLFLFRVLSLTYTWVVPSVWSFLVLMSETTTNSFIIKLEPRIYDYVVLTFFILFISSICSQIPLVLICLLEFQVLSIGTLTNNRSYLLVFSLLVAALLTPPDLLFQVLVFLLVYSLLEFSIFLAFLLRVHEDVCSS